MIFTSAHLVSLLLTLAVVTALGIYAARRVKTASDFAVGARSSGASLVVGTIIGTIIGGASTIGTAQLAFTVGIAAWWFTLGAGLALFILAFFYAAPLRSSNLQTIPQFLVKNYGAMAGPLTSLSSSVGIFFSVVSNILAALPLVSAIFGFSAVHAAGAVCLLTVVYVFFGGVWGTGLIGVLKTILIYVTLLTVGTLSFTQMGGVAGFLTTFPADPWFNLLGRGLWVDIGSGLSLIVGTLSTQTYIQAIYAARDVKAARLGALASALITLPTGLPAVMVGMFMRVHHPEINPIDALPLFILEYLPPWLGGVAIATLLLAAIGSAAGLVLGVSTMLSRDIISRYWRQVTESTLLVISRAAVLVITAAATLITFGNLKSLVLEWNFLSMGLRGAGIFLPLTAAVFWPGKVSANFALWSMAAGAGTSLFWKFIFPAGIDPLYPGLIVSGLLLAAGRFGRQNAKLPVRN